MTGSDTEIMAIFSNLIKDFEKAYHNSLFTAQSFSVYYFELKISCWVDFTLFFI